MAHRIVRTTVDIDLVEHLREYFRKNGSREPQDVRAIADSLSTDEVQYQGAELAQALTELVQEKFLEIVLKDSDLKHVFFSCPRHAAA